MPTVGWIQETAIDRYWERGEIGTQFSALERHCCPYCTREFQSTGELGAHISVEHPVERPLMFLNGREALSEQTIRMPLRSSDIEFANVVSLRVSRNGGQVEIWAPSRLKRHLMSRDPAHYAITLTNKDPGDTRKPVDASYVVRIKVADETQVASVDENFIRILAIDDVRMSDIRRFAEACARFRDADEYASALAVYATGVLIKDQIESTGVTRPFSEYKEKMQQALDVLRAYARPVPAAICAAIRLNLNDFGTPPIPCGVEGLDRTNEFFWRVGRGGPDQHPERFVAKAGTGKRPLCPVDRATYELLHTYGQVATRLATGRPFDDLERGYSSGLLADYDRRKFNALFAAASLCTGKKMDALPLLKDLANDPVFGSWAEQRLKRESE